VSLVGPKRETVPDSAWIWGATQGTPVPAASGTPEVCAWLVGVQSSALGGFDGKISAVSLQ
jgi:hypothetical protein